MYKFWGYFFDLTNLTLRTLSFELTPLLLLPTLLNYSYCFFILLFVIFIISSKNGVSIAIKRKK